LVGFIRVIAALPVILADRESGFGRAVIAPLALFFMALALVFAYFMENSDGAQRR
jgi:hypothetical protein